MLGLPLPLAFGLPLPLAPASLSPSGERVGRRARTISLPCPGAPGSHFRFPPQFPMIQWARPRCGSPRFIMKPFVPYSVCVWAAVLATSASVLSAPVPSPAREAASDPTVRLLRDASIMLLKEGNARYAADKPQHPHLDAERRASTGVQGQEPFATILACSDSRDPVELIFDRGVGDLFVVRVAGNVA